MVGGLAVGLLLGAVLMALVKDASNAPPRTRTRITQPVPGNENGGAPGGNIGAENSVMVCLSKLRSKLAEDPQAYIKTIRGIGYRLEK